MEYRLQEGYDGVVATQDDGSVLWIARSSDEPAWLSYQAWLASGNNPHPSPQMPVVVPRSVTRYQARAVLVESGLLDSVNAYFSALPDGNLDKLAWEEAPTVERDSSATGAASQALGLTAEQMDQLFIQAKSY